MRHHFKTTQWLPFPVSTVFAFFSNPQNLPPLMPAWQQARIEEARIVAPPPPPAGTPRTIATGVGTNLVLSFRPVPGVPLRLRWYGSIKEFEWNHHFCDEQTRGPFHYWRHCHSVKAQTQDGVEGTQLTDHVEFSIGLGFLGDAVTMVGIYPQFRYLFGVRHRAAAQLMPLFAARTQR